MGSRALSRTCVGAIGAGASLLALLATSGPAAAAPRPITGKLSQPGYTVIALAASGKARSVRAGRGQFRLAPPADSVTLHLRAANGKYAGPIVVRATSVRVIVGVRAGARLGRVIVRKGYAKVARRLRRPSLDASRTARARHGVPIGARFFGRVRSKPPRGGPAADRDLDGVPDPLDVDDDGDLILDNFDRPGAARAAQASEERFDEIQTSLGLELDQTANANAPGLTAQQIDAALPSFGRLDLEVLPGDSVELDCGRPQSRTDPSVGGLAYCSRRGTGRVLRNGAAPDDCPASPSDCPPFPDCCDADGDGFGTLTSTAPSPEGTPFAFLLPGATAAQIGTGDILIQRVTRAGAETQFAATLGYMFATVPALVSYSDGQGNSATVSYPVAGPTPGPPGPGTRGNGFPVKARPNGDVVVSLTFWRPQRKPIVGESGAWIDIGRLNYTASVADTPRGCRQNAFSESDPNLVGPVSYTGESNYDGLEDRAVDRPASPASTFTYTLNLTRCLESNGLSFNVGATRGFSFSGIAPASGDDASLSVFFVRQ